LNQTQFHTFIEQSTYSSFTAKIKNQYHQDHIKIKHWNQSIKAFNLNQSMNAFVSKRKACQLELDKKTTDKYNASSTKNC